MINPFVFAQSLMDKLHTSLTLQSIVSLSLRLYLAPIYLMAGMHKANGFSNVVQWFGNQEWGLGLPFPTVMAFLATGAELFGACALILGFAVRWATIPLMITMIVAATTVHWQHGWQAIHDLHSPWANEHATGAMERLEKAKEILQTHGHYDWLTEYGNFVVSNNGIEWAATYFIMLLALFFLGGGRYVSVDYWIRRKYMPNSLPR
ncbi:DoxX family protein [Thiomicrorhabdus sp. ZW0627]|uniref:HvfX family Cu-binding RiPP maturation protein n=1 Tax=Thiomicrorhabdus sp. ZW0627 TaxID=3039774 RepID=UPI002436AE22|nr:DoxX family protein [Thiomicrorhabdus sp. ZW0627]MDG6773560.1 DoxX family protein [Thiomicrorhabdus sp. ZW0627]